MDNVSHSKYEDYKNTERKIIIKNSLRSDKIKTMVNRFKNHCFNFKVKRF